MTHVEPRLAPLSAWTVVVPERVRVTWGFYKIRGAFCSGSRQYKHFGVSFGVPIIAKCICLNVRG